MGFLLKFLVITFGILYLVGFFARLWLRKLYKNFQQQGQNYSGAKYAEGEIIIEKKPNISRKKRDFSGGDYIEYEEVK